MHYQKQPYEQAKLISVDQGEVFDVALDIRENSSTYGKWISEILSSDNKKQMWIPEGFAHGFLALTNDAVLNYKTTNYYSPEHEITFKYNDPRFSIDWPKNIDYIISDKDM
jgi:dTDP-4-dehydrorhamnose 3,5-epimerase